MTEPELPQAQGCRRTLYSSERRFGLCAAGGNGGRVLVPGDRRPSRESGRDVDDEPAVLRVDEGDSERSVVQGGAGPHHRPGTHHRDGRGFVSFPANAGEEEEARVGGGPDGVPFWGSVLRSALRAPLRSEPTKRGGNPQEGLNSHRVGQNKMPKWTRWSCQKQGSGLPSETC